MHFISLRPSVRIASLWPSLHLRETTAAQRWAAPIAKLTSVLFRETSPGPLKYALSLLGFMSPKPRLPLVELSEAAKTEVAAVITQMRRDYPEFLIGQIAEPRHNGVEAVAA